MLALDHLEGGLPMASDGMWTMTDDGEFILDETYAEQLQEARITATAAWTAALIEYLDEHTIYDQEELKDELLRRCQEEGMQAMEIVNEFVLEALGGDL